ncbi:MAG: hypothetical protein JXD21_06530 [Candidatus Omnitrophica bacterium]|nr:hypothetical protein [Candidatus Omnitrophota bacterium]
MLTRSCEGKIREQAEILFGREGFDIVEFKSFRQGQERVIRIVADRPWGGITLDECGRLNRLFYAYVESQGAFTENFRLEVISPGLDWKLRDQKDFQRVVGRRIGVWLEEAFDGKTYIEGILRKITKEHIIIEGEGSWEIPLSCVQCAKQRINYE